MIWKKHSYANSSVDKKNSHNSQKKNFESFLRFQKSKTYNIQSMNTDTKYIRKNKSKLINRNACLLLLIIESIHCVSLSLSLYLLFFARSKRIQFVWFNTKQKNEIKKYTFRDSFTFSFFHNFVYFYSRLAIDEFLL